MVQEKEGGSPPTRLYGYLIAVEAEDSSHDEKRVLATLTSLKHLGVNVVDVESLGEIEIVDEQSVGDEVV